MSFPSFDRAVAANGYAWWYVDALSDDGRYGVTVIAFIGSVFSPYYAWARRRGRAAVDPREHCAVNVALYGPRGRWAMTERGGAALAAARDHLRIGPSALSWNDNALTIDIAEIGAPLPRRIHGRIRVEPLALTGRRYALDARERHHWSPIAPRSRVTVALTRPALAWRGAGYLDHNSGSEPLEAAFADWQWSRNTLAHDTAILYDVNRRDGSTRSLALRFDREGRVEPFQPPAFSALPNTRWWRVARATRAEEGAARVARTLEDTPFYARSALETTLLGERTTAIHESLSLQRFEQNWVRALLPFRIPRVRA